VVLRWRELSRRKSYEPRNKPVLLRMPVRPGGLKNHTGTHRGWNPGPCERGFNMNALLIVENDNWFIMIFKQVSESVFILFKLVNTKQHIE